MKRYNIITPRPKKDGGTHWHKIGAAFERDKGGLSLIFDSLPLPDDKGKVTAMVVDADTRPQRDEEQRGFDRGQAGHGPSYDDQDSIPFAPEWRA